MPRVALQFRGNAILSASILGGVLFLLFEMLATAVVQGANFFFVPLRMIGAIALGPTALEATAPLTVTVLTGVLVHMLLSLTFVSVFAAMVSHEWNTGPLAIAGMMFGFSLWIVNFYVIAPLAGWWWFPQASNPVVQVVAHILFFGCPVSWLLSRSRPR